MSVTENSTKSNKVKIRGYKKVAAVLAAGLLSAGAVALSGCGIVSEDGTPFTKAGAVAEQAVGSMEESPLLEYEMPGMQPSIVIGDGGFSELEVKYAWIKCHELPELFMVRDASTGENVYIGRPESVKPLEKGEGYKAKIEFAPVSEDGTYYLTADGLGCSYEFTVSSTQYQDLFWSFMENECERCRSGEATAEEVYMCLYSYERYKEVLYDLREDPPDVPGAVKDWIASADFDNTSGEEHYIKIAILSKFARNYSKTDEALSKSCIDKAAAMYRKNEACDTDEKIKATFLAASELYKTTGEEEYSKKITDMYEYLDECEDLHSSRYILYGSMTYMTTKYWVDKTTCDMLISKLLYRARDIGDDKFITDPETASYDNSESFLICAQQLAVMNYVLDGYEYNEIIMNILHYLKGRNFEGSTCDMQGDYPADAIAIYSWVAWLEKNGKLDPAAPVVWNYSW